SVVDRPCINGSSLNSSGKIFRIQICGEGGMLPRARILPSQNSPLGPGNSSRSTERVPEFPFESLTQCAPHIAPLCSIFTAFKSAGRDGLDPPPSIYHKGFRAILPRTISRGNGRVSKVTKSDVIERF